MLTWLPYYLQTARGVDLADTGFIASLVPWASIPGAILFGFLSDKIKSKKPLIIFWRWLERFVSLSFHTRTTALY